VSAKIKRRAFISLLGGAGAWPLAARAQQPARVRRIGVIMNYAENDAEGQIRLSALRDAFRKLGWTEGDSRIDYCWTAGNSERGQSCATQMVSLPADAIIVGSTPMLAQLSRLTRSVPVVFVQVADPVGSGFVANYAQPGGNITGFTDFETSIAGKWIEFLKQAAPSIDRVAVLLNPEQGNHAVYWRVIESTAASLKIKVAAARVRDGAKIEQAVTRIAGEGGRGLVVLPNPVFNAARESIIQSAARYRLPAIYPFKYYAKDGGLLYYGIDQVEQWPMAASYVDRILKGERPADLPVQAPTKYELVINLKTAKALDLEVPLQLQQLADEVIE
jgi:putative ABC transport system substrate-binding protein